MPKPKQGKPFEYPPEADIQELNQIQEEEFDEMGNTIGMHETNREQQLQLLDAKNQMYANELDKIKQLFEWK